VGEGDIDVAVDGRYRDGIRKASLEVTGDDLPIGISIDPIRIRERLASFWITAGSFVVVVVDDDEIERQTIRKKDDLCNCCRCKDSVP
jgi:hypothetical protein